MKYFYKNTKIGNIAYDMLPCDAHAMSHTIRIAWYCDIRYHVALVYVFLFKYVCLYTIRHYCISHIWCCISVRCLLPQQMQYFIVTRCSVAIFMFFTEKTKRSTNSEIVHQLQYAIKCTLYNVDCLSPARTTRMCLCYQLGWCTTCRQVIITIQATPTSRSTRLPGVPKTAFTKKSVPQDRVDVRRWARTLSMHLEMRYMTEYLTSPIDGVYAHSRSGLRYCRTTLVYYDIVPNLLIFFRAE